MFKKLKYVFMFVHIYRTEISFKACRSPVSRILSQFFFLIVRRFENISYTKRPRASLFRRKIDISVAICATVIKTNVNKQAKNVYK